MYYGGLGQPIISILIFQVRLYDKPPLVCGLCRCPYYFSSVMINRCYCGNTYPGLNIQRIGIGFNKKLYQVSLTSFSAQKLHPLTAALPEVVCSLPLAEITMNSQIIGEIHTLTSSRPADSRVDCSSTSVVTGKWRILRKRLGELLDY